MTNQEKVPEPAQGVERLLESWQGFCGLVGLPPAALLGLFSAITGSPTLRYYMIGGGILGFVVALFLTTAFYKRKGIELRKKRSLQFLVISAAALLTALLVLFTIYPDVSQLFPFIGDVRDTLVVYDLVPDILLAICTAIMSGFFAAGISILAPHMKAGA
jgi:membrane-associated HD superfamily phosphohydrolase